MSPDTQVRLFFTDEGGGIDAVVDRWEREGVTVRVIDGGPRLFYPWHAIAEVREIAPPAEPF